ncbi:hypothetical protein CPB85DRAFT_644238 [Mucidula mucida]|nr:hypothetical protein CPB85DRAFT_644238 [Mucidula mucida]
MVLGTNLCHIPSARQYLGIRFLSPLSRQEVGQHIFKSSALLFPALAGDYDDDSAFEMNIIFLKRLITARCKTLKNPHCITIGNTIATTTSIRAATLPRPMLWPAARSIIGARFPPSSNSFQEEAFLSSPWGPLSILMNDWPMTFRILMP